MRSVAIGGGVICLPAPAWSEGPDVWDILRFDDGDTGYW